ncbi:hypothetical protein FIA58_013175 [Flavobacterium jejuense]|uniref:Uncharacterized protein n=1 Tax=Flavobacterium jejuense TaxID=1544455 RepID=A0ABX0ISU4_9FLAO|nr:hypothetical protein [Flavobacterium jejuense]NHN26631.1 hypothetical protein [Flavobacterium jejuense]
MKLSFIENLPTTSTLELCKQMANFAKKVVDSSSLPKLELLLHNGTFITGRIINFHENANKQYIWIENNIDIPEKINVFLLEVNQIIGISILDYDAYQTGVELVKPIEIIGVLELKRKKKSIEELLEKLFAKPIIVSVDIDNLYEENRSIIYKNLSFIATALQEILSDEISKSVVNEKVNIIQVNILDRIEVTLSNEILFVSIKKDNTQTSANQIKILKEKIESVF